MKVKCILASPVFGVKLSHVVSCMNMNYLVLLSDLLVRRKSMEVSMWTRRKHQTQAVRLPPQLQTPAMSEKRKSWQEKLSENGRAPPEVVGQVKYLLKVFLPFFNGLRYVALKSQISMKRRAHVIIKSS